MQQRTLISSIRRAYELMDSSIRRHNLMVDHLRLLKPETKEQRLIQREGDKRSYYVYQATVNSLKSGAHRPDLFGEYFDRLNTLYLLL